MKRILFWAVSMFALGEVTYLYVDRIAKYSIALAMLICVVFLLVKKKKLLKTYAFLAISFIIGFSYIMLRDFAAPILYSDAVLSNEEVLDYDEFKVMIQGKSEKNIYFLDGEGLITEVNGTGDEGDITIRLGSGFNAYKIIVYGVRDDYEQGDTVKINGNISSIDSPTNVGVMNMYNYYRARGILFSATAKDIQIYKVDTGDRKSWVDIYYRFCSKLQGIRERLEARLDDIADETTSSFFKGILLGEKNQIEDYRKKLYQLNGIAHIIVISGLHISILGGIVFKIFSCLGLRHFISTVFSICFVLLYGVMSGMGFATLRAIIMLVISMIGSRLGKDYDMATSMSVALIITLLIEPFRILDGGIWLSYGAVSGVIMGRYIIRIIEDINPFKKLKKKRKKIYKLICTLIVTLSVNIVLSPVILFLYFELPIYSLLSNMLVVPMMGTLIFIGIFGLALSCISLIWGFVIFIPGKYIIEYVTYVCELIIKLPYHTINYGQPEIVSIVIYYITLILILLLIKPKHQEKIRKEVYRKLGCWLDYKRWIWVKSILISVILLMGVCGIILSEKHSEKALVYFVDVGQGDCIIIRNEDGNNMIIDGGSVSNSKLGEYVLLPVIKYFGMSEIDYWFVTHSDTDHTSGLIDIMSQGKLSGIRIKNIVIPETKLEEDGLSELISTASKLGTQVIYFTAGNKIEFEESEIICVAPVSNQKYEDKNQASLGLLYEAEGVNMLFTGDMDKEALQYMYEANRDRFLHGINVLKIPHHGSKYSICEKLLQGIKPNISIISAGENNIYGHPHQETLEELKEIGSAIIITSERGGILIEIK